MEDDGPPGVPEWVVTYGDMMSLLLTFFIMLVSMSELKDEGKNRAALNALQKRFGPTDGHSGVMGRTFAENSALDHAVSTGNVSRNGLEENDRDATGPGGAEKSVEEINSGEIVTIGGAVTFGQYQVELSDETRTELDRIVEAIRKHPERVMVRGHAFAEPVRKKPQFRNQHDLSFARAQSVAKYLMEQKISPGRILVSAAGDAEPRVRTRDIATRRLNRRVDVFTVGNYVPRPDSG